MYTLTNIDQHHFSGPEDVYVLEAHRTAAGLATVASDQTLSLFNPARLGTGPVARLRTEHGNVTTLRVFDAGTSVVCTAGENGSVGVWDLRQGARVAQFTAGQASILSMACSASTQTIAVGTELENHAATIHLWDVRSNPSPKATYSEVHSDDVTSLAFHPSQPSLLVSGSTDGLVSVHDTAILDEDELTVQTLNHNASIHDAAFLNATELFALSHDEAFALYDVADERETGDAAQDFGDLRKVLGCQYVANVTTKVDGSGAILGAGAQDKENFELIFLAKAADGSWALDLANKVVLPGAHGSEIVRSFCFFDDEQVVFTTGEDGNVKAWRAG
ncbi:WD40-repeat-containing domain protein [Trichoderma sp. SZMC 28013]